MGGDLGDSEPSASLYEVAAALPHGTLSASRTAGAVQQPQDLARRAVTIFKPVDAFIILTVAVTAPRDEEIESPDDYRSFASRRFKGSE